MFTAMGAGLLVALSQFVWAFLAFDLVLRVLPVQPDRLERNLRRYRRHYGWVALVFCMGGAWAQHRLGGPAGLVFAAANWVPWWLLWRFGLRKQFPFLFPSGREKSERAQEPDR